MNGGLMLGVAGLAGAMLGALLGGLFAWRWLGARLVREVPLQLRAAMAPLLQAHLECMQPSTVPTAVVSAIAPSWVEALLQAATTAATHAERAEQGVRDAVASAAAALESLEAAQQATLRALQDVLQRIPQASQQASKVETIAPAVTSVPIAPTSISTLPALSARPPQWLLTPLPQPEPVYDESEPVRELSDDEIDALPPDLPMPDKARKRILPTPKKPVLRNL